VPDSGPHVAIAALCERVITEGDGVLSIIRVVDRVTQTATGPDPPDKMPPLVIQNVQMVFTLKADQAKGRHVLKFFLNHPDPTRREVIGEQDITLIPGNQGVNLVIGLQLELAEEGVHWIDVMFGPPGEEPHQLLTRVPLEVMYQRQRVPIAPDHSDQ
jgi:hypothetical protein